ncbi:MAG: porin [Nannocystaceae bacterium]|nr:OprO/OprP family phosphate-selective porin [bacterium]
MPNPAAIVGLAAALSATPERAASEPAAPEPGAPGPADRFEVVGGGDGVRWTSADEAFSLGLTLRAQMRYTASVQGSDAEQSLLIRRARLKSAGWIFGKSFRYQLELGLSPRDMGKTENGARFSPLLDWYFEFAHLRDLTLRVGQSKLAYSLTRVQSSGDLQFVDRSIANAEFNLDRDIAVDLRSYDFLGLGKFRYFAGLFIGEGRDARGATNFEMGYFGRVEAYPLGNDDTHGHQADFARTRHARLMLAAAYAYLDGATRDRGTRGDRPEDGGTTDMHNATVDASLKVAGVSLLGEAFWRQTSRVAPEDLEPDTPVLAGRDGWGWNAQAGYLMGIQPVEFAMRYAEVHPLSRAPIRRTRQPGGVVGWYLLRHAVKLQLDYHATVQAHAPLGHEIRLQFQGSL